MNYRYFDAHCHVQFEDYAHDEEEVIARMRENGISGIVVGVDRSSSEKAVRLAEKYDNLYASVGLHPNVVGSERLDLDAFRTLAAHPKVVAIGECGLDYYRPKELTEEVKRAQAEALRAQIDLAAFLDKPLIIHSRPSKGTPSSVKATEGTQDAYHDLIGILKEKKVEHGAKVRGDIHFFVGGVAEAEALFVLDFTVSFTAVITFARDYDAVIRSAPLNRILSETDAPYLSPASRRHERNDPLAVEEVVAKLAEIRGEELESVRTAVVANAARVFGL